MKGMVIKMDKEFIIGQLFAMTEEYGLDIEASTAEELIHNAEIRVIKKGELMGHIGEISSRAGLVLDGMVRCYYIDEDGNDITRGFAVRAMLCMDEGLFGYPEYICEWEALDDTVIMFFDTAALKEMISAHDDLKNSYIMLLENALKYKIYRENGFLVENASQRYIHFKKLYPTICEKVAQRHLATYLGIAPESLSRIRKAMKENED